MSKEQIINYVVLTIVLGSLAIGLLSMLVGQIVRVLDRWKSGPAVNDSQPLMSSPQTQAGQTEQTDGADRRQTVGLSAFSPDPPRYALDRTRQAVLEELLTHGWTITDLRREGILRGDNTKIGEEVEGARRKLGLPPAEGYRTPIVGRSTDAKFQDALN